MAIIVCAELFISLHRVWFLDEASAMWEEKLRLVDQGAVDGDVVIIGSSRMMHGVIPAVLAQEIGPEVGCYNLSLTGMLAPASVVTLERYLERGQRPKVICFEVVVGHLAGALRECYAPPFLRLLYDWPDIVERQHHLFDPRVVAEWAVYAALPSARYRAGLDNLLSRAMTDGRLPTEYRDRNRRIAEEFATMQGFRFWRTAREDDPWNVRYPYPFEVDSAAEHYLRRAIETCARYGARCVLMASPLPEAHHRALVDNGYLDALARWLGELTADQPETFFIPSVSLPNACFLDATHLNRRGAPIYSRRLGRWLADHRYALGLSEAPAPAMADASVRNSGGESTVAAPGRYGDAAGR